MREHDDSPFDRFASAHLAAGADRAVFMVLAGSRARTWTAADAAHDARVSALDADLVLRRFEGAGVVERLADVEGPVRYRWSAEMAYLHDGTEPPGPVDPVCGMPVASDSPHIADHDGEEIAFCSVSCLVRWRAGQRGRSPR